MGTPPAHKGMYPPRRLPPVPFPPYNIQLLERQLRDIYFPQWAAKDEEAVSLKCSWRLCPLVDLIADLSPPPPSFSCCNLIPNTTACLL